MSHEIDPPSHYVAGESLTQEFTIEEDGSAKDITGADITWSLLPVQGADTADAILDGSDTGVTVSIPTPGDGRIDVAIDQDVTTDYGGRHLWQRLVVDDDGAPGKQIWSGPFPIARP